MSDTTRYKVTFSDANGKTLKVSYVQAPKYNDVEAIKLAKEKLPDGFKYHRVWAREKKRENIFY